AVEVDQRAEGEAGEGGRLGAVEAAEADQLHAAGGDGDLGRGRGDGGAAGEAARLGDVSGRVGDVDLDHAVEEHGVADAGAGAGLHGTGIAGTVDLDQPGGGLGVDGALTVGGGELEDAAEALHVEEGQIGCRLVGQRHGGVGGNALHVAGPVGLDVRVD